MASGAPMVKLGHYLLNFRTVIARASVLIVETFFVIFAAFFLDFGRLNRDQKKIKKLFNSSNNLSSRTNKKTSDSHILINYNYIRLLFAITLS